MKKNKIIILLLSLLLAVNVFTEPAFAAVSEATVELEVEKRLTGDTPTSAEEFTFLLEAKDNAPMPEKDTLAITGTGSGKFGVIRYTEPGDYVYSLREADNKTEGYTYDTAIYTVTVQVTTDDLGVLKAVVYMEKEGGSGKADQAVFENRYEEKQSSTPPALEEHEKPDVTNPTENHPKTGDTAHLNLWLAVTGISALGICVLFFADRKYRNKEQ